MKVAVIYALLTVLILLKLTLNPLFQSDSQRIGSKSNPIRIMLTPSVEASKVTTSAEALVHFLEQKTGLSFSASVPASFVVVVESFGSGGVDMAITNTFSYVLAHDKYGAEAAMMVVRRNGEKTYRGQIIARKESGIRSVEDLQGKSFAFVDAVSTSGYVLPRAVLHQHNIRLSDSVFAGKHDNVVTMVYQGQVDAGATYYSPPDSKTGEILDARIRVLPQFPDVLDAVRIVALTDDIPNDPVVFRKSFPPELREKITNALMEFQATKEGSAVLKATYSVEGLAPAKDSDYDKLRTLIRTFGTAGADASKKQ